MYKYVQLIDNVVICVTESSNPIPESETIIAIEEDVATGSTYNDGIFIPPKAPTELNVIITSAKIDDVEQEEDYRLKVPQGSVTKFNIQLQANDGSLIPVGTQENPEHFAFPIEGLLGKEGRTVGASFVEGEAEINIAWPTSGEYRITESALNLYISDVIYRFKGLSISVYE